MDCPQESARFLKSNLKLVGKLRTARRYRSDELVLDLGPAMADAALGISALHFYTFNQLDSTEEWYRGMIKALESGSI
jgi:methylenetetrahydrofolate reductase (NADPH)